MRKLFKKNVRPSVSIELCYSPHRLALHPKEGVPFHGLKLVDFNISCCYVMRSQQFVNLIRFSIFTVNLPKRLLMLTVAISLGNRCIFRESHRDFLCHQAFVVLLYFTFSHTYLKIDSITLVNFSDLKKKLF